MKTNKALVIHEAFVNLPDDFEGTLGDALSFWANYTLEQEAKNNMRHIPKEEHTFEDLEQDSESRASVTYELGKRVDGVWEPLNKNQPYEETENE